MNIVFMGETRKTFSLTNTEGAVPTLGSFQVKEMLVKEKWNQATEVTASFCAPMSWVQEVLFPSTDPGSLDPSFRRACYFTIRNETDEQLALLIQTFNASIDGEGVATVEIVGRDIRAKTSTIPGASEVYDPNWVGTVGQLAKNVTDRMSNAALSGKSQWQKLPASTINLTRDPSVSESAIGVVRPDTTYTSTIYTVPNPDPLPVQDALADVLSRWKNTELYPLYTPAADGTDSPWWTWVARQRVASERVFSQESGTLQLNRVSVDNTLSEVLAYDSNNSGQFSYASGRSISRPALYGPWLGVNPISISPPEASDPATFLRGKANTASQNLQRLVVDLTVNFTAAAVKPVCGMTIYVRFSENIFQVTADELTRHYSNEKGWSTESSVFIGADTVDFEAPVYDEAIQLVVEGSSFRLPTNNIEPAPYQWLVYVDGVFVNHFYGTSDPNGDGILLTFSHGGQHHIRIEELNRNYTAGWSRALSFPNFIEQMGPSDTTYGNGLSCSQSNRDKLIQVVSDYDRGHLQSTTSTGNGFRMNQWANCSSLISIAPGFMPQTVTTIGDNAYDHQYYACSSLAETSSEMMGENVASVGDYYKFARWSLAGVTQTEAEDLSESTVAIGDYYLADQYLYCSSLIGTATPEAAMTNVLTIGANFRAGQYADSSISIAASEAAMPKVIHILDSYRRGQYGNTNITICSSEATMPNVETIGTHFRDSQYSGSSVSIGANEATMPKVTQIPEHYRSYQYAYTDITLMIPEGNISAVTTIGGYYRAWQYRNTPVQIPIGSRECSMPIVTEVGNWFRFLQFYNTPNLGSYLAESMTQGTLGIGQSFRREQYNNAVVNSAIPPEEQLALDLVNSDFTEYRVKQFFDSNPNTSGQRVIEATSANDSTASGSTNYRHRQYGSSLGAPLTKNLYFRDGRPAIPGSDGLPASFST